LADRSASIRVFDPLVTVELATNSQAPETAVDDADPVTTRVTVEPPGWLMLAGEPTTVIV
jgi:hypothetical protein